MGFSNAVAAATSAAGTSNAAASAASVATASMPRSCRGGGRLMSCAMATAKAGDIPIPPAAVNCGSVSESVGTAEVSAGVGTTLLLVLLPMLLM
jgi:hypothetical protein